MTRLPQASAPSRKAQAGVPAGFANTNQAFGDSYSASGSSEIRPEGLESVTKNAFGTEPKLESPSPKPRPGSDMEEMVARISGQLPGEEVRATLSSNGTIALLESPKPEHKLQKGDSEAADDLMTAGGLLIEGVEHTGNQALQSVGEAIEQGSETVGSLAETSSQSLEQLVGVSAELSGALAAPILWRGVKNLKEGFRNRDLDQKLEGVNKIGTAARSTSTSVVMANMLTGVTTKLVKVASIASPVLGVATAGLEGYLGFRDFSKGDKEGGIIRMGYAAGLGSSALGGGPVATAVMGGFMGAKVARKFGPFVERELKEMLGQKKPTYRGT